MRSLATVLILFFSSVTSSCQANTVLLCKGTSSYAYHDHHCEGLNRCRAKIETVTLSKAKSMGRTPCGYCYKTASTGKKETVKPSVPGQCAAITKRGTQCS